MTQILLVGTDESMLEGLAQSFAAQGLRPRVTCSIADARSMAVTQAPLIVIVDRGLVTDAGGDSLGIPLAAGGAFVLYRTAGTIGAPLSHSLQRLVLADVSLPLERNRLIALVQHLQERAVAVGHHIPTPRSDRATPL